MTIVRQYRCNFCGVVSRTDADIQGFYFVAGDGLELRRASEVENHLCESCFSKIHSAFVRRSNEIAETFPPE